MNESITRKFKFPSKWSTSIFIVAFATILSALAIGAFYSRYEQRGAIRFVPTDAVSFFVIPDVGSFMAHGAGPVLSIVNFAENKTNADFVSLFSKFAQPDTKRAAQSTHAAQSDAKRTERSAPILTPGCRIIRSAQDLVDSGIELQSSMSAARLDLGARAAVKLRDETRGIAFITDVLYPIYVQFAAGDDSEAEGNYNFNVELQLQDAVACIDGESVTQQFQKTLSGNGKQLNIPIRVDPNASSPTLTVKCVAAFEPEGAPTPCTCSVFRYQVGRAEIDRRTQRSCASSLNLGEERDTPRQIAAAIAAGNTVQAGDLFIGKIGDFHVVDQLISSTNVRGYKVAEPAAAIISDDSLLRHIRAIVSKGLRHEATIYGGARPDWLTENAGVQMWALPFYLMTPVGLHFREGNILIDGTTNLEPQDMALVQQLAFRTRQSDPAPASNSVGGMRFQLADSSLKTYSDFLRRHHAAVEDEATSLALEIPIVLDLMQASARTILSTVAGIDSDDKARRLRLALLLPGVSSEEARRLLIELRRALLIRRAHWSVKAAENAAKRLHLPLTKDSAVDSLSRLLCPDSLWALNPIVKPGRLPKVLINESALASEASSWSYREGNNVYYSLGPARDVNVTLWGAPGFSSSIASSISAANKDILTALRSSLTDSLSKLEQTDSESWQQEWPTILETIIANASSAEARHPIIARTGIVSKLKSLEQISEPDVAKNAFSEFVNGLDEDSISNSSQPNEDDIKKICNGPPQGSLPAPVLLYNATLQMLLIANNADDLKQQTALISQFDRKGPGSERREGKIRFTFSTREYATMLEQSKRPDENEIKNLLRFPFSLVHVDLEGRDKGNGLSATVSFQK